CRGGWRRGCRLGPSHAIGHVLGGTCDVPHYLCTPAMMPGVLDYNEPESRPAQRLLAAALGPPDAGAWEAFRRFLRTRALPTRLADVGVGESQFELIAQNTMHEFFIFSNPRPARTPEAVIEMLRL